MLEIVIRLRSVVLEIVMLVGGCLLGLGASVLLSRFRAGRVKRVHDLVEDQRNAMLRLKRQMDRIEAAGRTAKEKAVPKRLRAKARRKKA